MPHYRSMRSLYTYVTSRLKDREGEWKDAAKFAGVHRKTIVRIVTGAVTNPGVLTMEKLALFLRKNPRRETHQ